MIACQGDSISQNFVRYYRTSGARCLLAEPASPQARGANPGGRPPGTPRCAPGRPPAPGSLAGAVTAAGAGPEPERAPGAGGARASAPLAGAGRAAGAGV